MSKLIIGILSAVLLLQVFAVVSAPRVLVGPQGPQGLAGAASPADQTTNWIAGSFSGDLTAGGNAIGVAKTYSSTMSTTATTTACFITPSIATRRVITAVGVIDSGTAASTGAVNWTVGTSTYTGVAPTGVKLVSNVLTRASGVDVLSTTSTVQTAYSSVNPGESIIFQTGTTTNAGICYVVLN